MTEEVAANHAYWLSKEGLEYRRAHEIRLARGPGSYAAQEKWLKERLAALKAVRRAPLRLLDFGCGYGRIAHLCAEIGGIDYFGFDFSLPMAKPLLDNPPEAYAADVERRVIVGSIDRLNFPPGSFDIVLTVSVLIHNNESDAKAIISNLKTLCKRDGEIILIENVVVSKTTFSNYWHAGCWAHNFLEYFDEKTSVIIDEDMDSSHAVYILSDAVEHASYVVRAGSKDHTFSDRASLLEARARRIGEEGEVAKDALGIARLFDRGELAGAGDVGVDPNVEITESYRLSVRRKLIEKFIGINNFEEGSSALEMMISDHVERRFTAFKTGVLPWLQRHVGLAKQKVVEVGSGTGASTLALVPHVDHVHCFEIDNAATEVADYRLRFAGYDNYSLQNKLFDADSAREIGPFDGVFLAAVLEHTSFDECVAILRNAWENLRPNGWICVVDTPNRFCSFDHHTALLPFFSMLPAEVRLAYANRSPRADFASAFAAGKFPDKQSALESLTRWGAGISYHEFEIALGENVHQQVIADGYEPEIEALIGTTQEDVFARTMIDTFAKGVHRAFARRAFYMILKKAA